MSEEKNIFDKKCVYFMWADKLAGKEGFYSDGIAYLIMCVESNSLEHKGYVKRNCENDTYQFNNVQSDNSYQFFYYDPLYNIKWEWKQGKQIQSRSKVWRDAEWEDDDYPQWNNQCMEFRVRPEGFVPKKKWRPFKDIEELKQTWEKKFDPLVHPELFEPMIWVRSKSNTTSTYLISHFCGNVGVVHIYSSLDTSLEQLYEDFTFLDGTPCGVEE